MNVTYAAFTRRVESVAPSLGPVRRRKDTMLVNVDERRSLNSSILAKGDEHKWIVDRNDKHLAGSVQFRVRNIAGDMGAGTRRA